MRGVKEGSVRGTYSKYTNEEIIEALSKYETITDLRAGEDTHFYYLAKRSARERKITKREERELRRVEKLKLKEEKEQAKLEKKRRGPYNLKNGDKTIASRMYREIEIDGEPICGRCLEYNLNNGRAKENASICQSCYNKYIYLRAQGLDSNPHNVKDEYCHIRITHHEKIFTIGIKTEQKLQDYLTLVGYSFIFKDV
jgi:hypothetical protein